jgi:hypothetical protein
MLLVEQGRSLRSYCQQPGTPALTTVLKWRKTNPEFAARFSASREFGIETLAEATLDDASLRARPPDRRYADKLDARHEVSGPNGAPISLDIGGLLHTTLLTPENLEKLSDAEAEAWQLAISTVPKLLAPTPTTEPVEGTEE